VWRYRFLLITWVLTIGAYVYGFFSAPGWTITAQLVAVIVAIVTVRRADKHGVLRYRFLYLGAVGLLFLTTATVLVTAGSTVASGNNGDRAVGFIALATTNLVATIIAWRAFTNPAPRRAAIVGMVAVVAELFAIIIDAVISINLDYVPGTLGTIALWGSFAATWAGALVCIASLISFEHADTVNLPGARIVDEN
jgi:hypothetical protein